MLAFLHSFDQAEIASRVSIIKLTYLYYKSDTTYTAIKERFAAKDRPVDKNVYIIEDSYKSIEDLVKQVHENGRTRDKVKAMLYHVYHHSLHNRLKEAKDVMMKSHMSQLVNRMPIEN